MFTFSDDYILKSMWEMVRDEGNRIVSLGLASHDDLKKLIEPAVEKAVKHADGSKDFLLKSLAELHGSLKAVYLPGDFEKAGEDKLDYLLEAPRPTPDKAPAEGVVPEDPEVEGPDPEEEVPGDKPEETDPEKDLDEVAEEEPEGIHSVLSVLDTLVYKLGTEGNHEGAYKIERVMRKIERLADSMDKEDIKKLAEEIKLAVGDEGEESPFDSGAEPMPEEKSQGEQSIAVSGFAKNRHTQENKYSHFGGSWDQLIQLVKQNFSMAKQGYREGVLEVPVPAEGFFTSIVELKPGAQIAAKYEARREGEDPYMQLTQSGGEKSPAKSVMVILYSHDALAEGNEENTGADWEIVSINASPWEGAEGESEPLMPEALMRNYFEEPGGSKMEATSAEQFVEMLKKSRDYWRKKIMLG